MLTLKIVRNRPRTLLCSVPKSTPTTAMMKVAKEKESSKRVECKRWRKTCFYAPKNASAHKRPTRPRARSPAFQVIRPSFHPLPTTIWQEGRTQRAFGVHRYRTSPPRGAVRTGAWGQGWKSQDLGPTCPEFKLRTNSLWLRVIAQCSTRTSFYEEHDIIYVLRSKSARRVLQAQ